MSSGETVVYKSSEGSQCSVSLNTGDHYISIISDNDYVSSLAEIVALRILMGFNDYQHGENPSLKFELDNSLKKALNEPYSKEKTVIGETQKYRYEITLFNLSATLSNTYNKKSTIIDVK